MSEARKAFEAWAKLAFPHMSLLKKGDTDKYVYKTANFACEAFCEGEAWQASRAGQAASEPVAEVAQVGGSPVVFWDKSLPVGTKLYTHTDSGGNQAVSVPEWIKCSDRMPAERCLMFTDNDGLGVMYRIIPAGLVNSASEGTHWMPLPKPPKQEQDHE